MCNVIFLKYVRNFASVPLSFHRYFSLQLTTLRSKTGQYFSPISNWHEPKVRLSTFHILILVTKLHYIKKLKSHLFDC